MKNFTPRAALALSNHGGIEIELDRCGDSLRYRYYGKVAPKRCSVNFTAAGRAFFTARRRRFYLDEFLTC